MPALNEAAERENLFQEIFDILRQWSELERSVFSQAHYRGQSAQAISRSLQLDVKEVSSILKRCESRLHASLRNSRGHYCGDSLTIAAEPEFPEVCGQALNRLGGLDHNPGIPQTSI